MPNQPKKPVIVCDSSSLISLSETCNIEALQFIAKLGARLLIPPEVRNEVYARPSKIPKYAFSALRINRQLQCQALQLSSPPGLAQATQQFLNASNNAFSFRGRRLQLVQKGEAECVALCLLEKADGLLIDEKTTRLLIEDPRTLLERIGGEYEGGVQTDKAALAQLRQTAGNIFCMRSSELLGVAAGAGFFSQYGEHEQQAYAAALTALRDNGCAIATDEIAELAATPLAAGAAAASPKTKL